MTITIGNQLRSARSTLKVVVVHDPDGDGELTCAGASMGADVAPSAGIAQREGQLLELGKRYVDEQSSLEILVVMSGVGPLMYDGRELTQKTTKPLPISD